MDNIKELIDITDDWFYQQGIEKGLEKDEIRKSLEVCISLIQALGLTDEHIVEVVGLDIKTVQTIRSIVANHPTNFRELVMNLFLEKNKPPSADQKRLTIDHRWPAVFFWKTPNRFSVFHQPPDHPPISPPDLLPPIERKNLFTGGQWIVFEQSLRFLTDFLAGDVYYKTSYPAHNLVRARNQLALLREIGRAEGAIKGFLVG